MSDLEESSVKSALSTKWLGHHYHYLESTRSTNDFLKEWTTQGDTTNPPAGTVVLTDYQSHGRGRFDRRWEAPPGTSLLLSILLRPDWPGIQSPWLTMIAGTAVVEAIEGVANLSAALKWPNDVVIEQNNIWHKVCGILLEGHVTAEQRLGHAILGIGINVNIPAENLANTPQPATSLALAAQRPISRVALLAALLERIETLYERADGGMSPHDTWNRHLMTIGRRVEVRQSNLETTLFGIAESTGEWGQLLIRDDSGCLHSIVAGDVTLRMGLE